MFSNNNSPYLEYDLDEIISKWYEIDVTEKISELSRQIRTLMNYKSIIIRIRFHYRKTPILVNQNQTFVENKREFEKFTQNFIQILKIIKIDKKSINFYENNEDLKRIIKKLLFKIHYFSEQRSFMSARFLNLIIMVVQEIYDILNHFDLQFDEFYKELKLNYALLEKEIENFIQINRSRDKKLLDSKSMEVLTT